MVNPLMTFYDNVMKYFSELSSYYIVRTKTSCVAVATVCVIQKYFHYFIRSIKPFKYTSYFSLLSLGTELLQLTSNKIHVLCKIVYKSPNTKSVVWSYAYFMRELTLSTRWQPVNSHDWLYLQLFFLIFSRIQRDFRFHCDIFYLTVL